MLVLWKCKMEEIVKIDVVNGKLLNKICSMVKE